MFRIKKRGQSNQEAASAVPSFTVQIWTTCQSKSEAVQVPAFRLRKTKYSPIFKGNEKGRFPGNAAVGHPNNQGGRSTQRADRGRADVRDRYYQKKRRKISFLWMHGEAASGSPSGCIRHSHTGISLISGRVGLQDNMRYKGAGRREVSRAYPAAGSSSRLLLHRRAKRRMRNRQSVLQ